MTTDTPKSRGAGCLPIVAMLLAAALPLLTGCDPAAEGQHSTERRPGAGQAQHQPDPHGQQPAPVQGDPGAHNSQPGLVGLFVSWESENNVPPVCEWHSPRGAEPCANIRAKRDDDGVGWYGLWEHDEPAVTGQTYSVLAQGTGAMRYVTCEIAWKGKIYPGTSQGSRCGATLVLP